MSTRRVAVAALALAASACARVAPVSRATPDGAARVYSVAGLSFEAPSDWRAEGGPRNVKLTAPGGEAVVEAKATAVPGTPAACLAGAGESLERGSVGLTGVRRHPSSFACLLYTSPSPRD